MNYDKKFNFAKTRNKFFTLSIIITILGLLTLLIFGLKYGVDFKSGTTLDISLTQSADRAKVEQIFKDSGLSTPVVTMGGDQNDRVTARFDTVLDADQIKNVMAAFKVAYGDNLSHEENTVDVALAKELAVKAIYAVAIASLGIIIYVSIRFEWRFAIAGIIALLHDVFIVVSIFSIFQLEVSLTFVAALLTIIGYSINDTIVTFDRIRENMRFSKVKTLEDLERVVNVSIWQTMTRTVYTALTVLFAAICLLIFGSEALKLFSLAMFIGLVCGAYSSIFIASQLYVLFKKNSLGKKIAAPAKTAS